MPTKTSICNLAAGQVAGNRITDVDNDDSDEAQFCRDNYADTVKAVLEERAWTFATKRFIWTPLASAPAWGYAYAFLVPNSVIRVWEVHKDDTYSNGANNVDWRKEVDDNDRNVIVCDLSTIYTKAVINVDDESRFSGQFAQAVATRMAALMAIPIAESRTLQTDMWSLYDNLLTRAGSMDGMQGKNDATRSNQFIKVR